MICTNSMYKNLCLPVKQKREMISYKFELEQMKSNSCWLFSLSVYCLIAHNFQLGSKDISTFILRDIFFFYLHTLQSSSHTITTPPLYSADQLDEKRHNNKGTIFLLFTLWNTLSLLFYTHSKRCGC